MKKHRFISFMAVIIFIIVPLYFYFFTFKCVTVVSDSVMQHSMPYEEWADLFTDLLKKGKRLRLLFPDVKIFGNKNTFEAYLSTIDKSETVVLMHTASEAARFYKTDLKQIFPDTGVCVFSKENSSADICFCDNAESGWIDAAEKLSQRMKCVAIVYSHDKEELARKLSETLGNYNVFLYKEEKDSKIQMESIAENIVQKGVTHIFCLYVDSINILASSSGDSLIIADWRFAPALEKKKLAGCVTPALSGIIVPFAGTEAKNLKVIGKTDANYEYVSGRIL